ncbi:MAG: hypothetical protein ABL921_12470 [Pirellula sp.]
MVQLRRAIGLSFLAIPLLATSACMVTAQEIGFSERYALSENRQATLQELIPETEPYFYYHCLHCQTSGKIGEARGYLDAWIAKFGPTEQNRRMQTRQFILEFKANPQATINHLRSEFGINVDHPAPRKNEAAELETKLDPNLIRWETILRSNASDLNRVENIALGHVTSLLSDTNNLRRWLDRIDRPDIPGLIDLIVRELKLQDSRGFGSAPIHNQLTIAQLLELEKRVPKILESNAFVQARLRRIRPHDDQSTEEPAVLREHLVALEDFVKGLPESQNSLKASVLYRRLEQDELAGNYDRNRFLQYLALPTNRPFANPDYLAKQSRRPLVDWNANYLAEALLSPIMNDHALVLRYLEHFFLSDSNVDSFSPFLDRDYLRKVFASTRILHGIGDSKTHYAQLSPDQQRELQSRIEVAFDVSNPKYFKSSDSVRLKLNLKNVPELLVRVYRINARNILSQQKRPVGTEIDLDGLVANVEKRITYAQAADRRHGESIELPELEGGGIWVVDALAGGLRSRTLIHKGHLHALQRRSNAGDVFRVFDADGRHVKNAKALYGNREFEADQAGDIVIPFGRDTKMDHVILLDGPVATIQTFLHNREAYSLEAGFLIDPQSLLSGSQASIVVRPNLLCNGELVSLAQLERPTLTVTSTDLDGIASTQTFSDIQLADSRELVKKFLVPPRLASLSVVLGGDVLLLSNDSRVSVSATHSISINESARTAKVQDFYLSQTDQGYYLELRGRNSEPAGRVPVQLELKLYGVNATTSVRLASDESGVVGLGALADVQWLRATSDAIGTREFSFGVATDRFPENDHRLSGESVERAISANAGLDPVVFRNQPNSKSPGRYSLIEYRGETVSAIHSDKVTTQSGLLKIAGLEPGTYRLVDYASGQSTRISVVKGQNQDDVLVGNRRILETNRVRPVHIENVSVLNDKVEIQIGNHDAFVRTHVIANAFVPAVGYRTSLPAPSFPISSLTRMRIPSFYLNSMKLDEEYQYVLQRQLANKYLGSLLQQPSVILNPWELSVTQNATKEAGAGDPMSAQAPKPAASSAPARPEGQGVYESARGLPDYEFLKRGSAFLANLECNDKGQVTIDRKNLRGLTSVSILVIHPSGSTYRVVALPSESREYSDRRLAQAFDATERLTEVQSVKILTGSDKHDLGAASSTRVKFYNSIPEVYQLYKTMLRGQSGFDKFECVGRWSTLKDDEKEVFYSDLACHEFHLFLLLHDKPFFERVVRPFLTNKLQKQFMDDYVLGADLTKYVQPWRMAQLNTVERVLLAKRVSGQGAAIRRALGDWVDMQPLDSASVAVRFATALEREMLLELDDKNTDKVRVLEELQRATGVESRMDSLRMSLSKTESESVKQKAGAFFSDFVSDEALQNGPAMAEKKSDQAALGRAFAGGGRGARAKLGKEVRLYETLESTRKWAESNYYRLAIQNQNAELVKPNAFWLDYLNREGDQTFLSKNVDVAASNVHEAMMALAVLGLPLKSEPVDFRIEGGRIVVANALNAIAFVKGLEKIEPSGEPAKVLASQNIYLADEPNEVAKPVQDKSLVKGTVYRLRLVLTNPGAIAIKANVLRQIPQGAIALENAKVVTGQLVDLAPFATQELSTKFYFPTAGTFSHYGSQIAIDGKLAIAAPSQSLKVTDVPDTVDESAWSYVALWGSNEQVLEHLKKANLFKIDLDVMAWRLSDRKFYDACLSRLSEYGVYKDTLWAYAIKHIDEPRIKEYLDRSEPVVQRVGASFRSGIMQVDPIERLAYEHLDFRPLVVARVHQLGSKRVILNDGLATQYERLMNILSHHDSIDSEQRLAIVYYMLLQNRIEEAIAHFGKIAPTSLEAKLQYDCFAVYLDMLQGKFDESESRSQNYVNYPIPRWKDWFAQVRSQVAERKALQAGRSAEVAIRENWKTEATNSILSGAREHRNANESEALPVLDLAHTGDDVTVRYRNLKEIEVNYYLMDVELLFSRSPFAQQDVGRLNTIEPNQTETRKLAEAKSTKEFVLALPEKLKNRNVAVEVVGGGLTRNLVIYANSLIVNVSPNMGRLQVMTKQGLQPLDGAYVKVYSKDGAGGSKFYKDGYTDLRGQFDYASLSTNDLDATQRFSLLVLHPEHGTMVREAEPPKR